MSRVSTSFQSLEVDSTNEYGSIPSPLSSPNSSRRTSLKTVVMIIAVMVFVGVVAAVSGNLNFPTKSQPDRLYVVNKVSSDQEAKQETFEFDVVGASVDAAGNTLKMDVEDDGYDAEGNQTPPVFGEDRRRRKLCKCGWYLRFGKMCVKCPKGYYCPNGRFKKQCKSGEYQNKRGKDKCKKPKCGRYVVPGRGSRNDQPCPVGSYRSVSDNPTKCSQASKGHFVGVEGSCTQLECKAGTYQDCLGEGACLPAPCGHTVAKKAQTSFKPCPAGTYQPLKGQTTCKTVPPGAFATVGACNFATHSPSKNPTKFPTKSPTPACGGKDLCATKAITVQKLWGINYFKGLNIASFTANELQLIGCVEIGSRTFPCDWVCTHTSTSMTMSSKKGGLRVLFGPGAYPLNRNSGAHCTASNRRSMCNAPVDKASVTKLCQQMGYNSGTFSIRSGPGNIYPEVHYAGGKWTSDWAKSHHIPDVITCSC